MEDLEGARAFGQADERMGYKNARKITCGRQTPDNTSYRGVSSLQARFFLSALKYNLCDGIKSRCIVEQSLGGQDGQKQPDEP